MWTYQGKAIKIGRSWTDADGVQHPFQWNKWSEEEKVAKGLVWNQSLQPTPFDNRFYWSAGNPKALENIPEVDEESNPVLDTDGNQIITKGLKSTAIAQTKTTAGSLLTPTDWYVVRKSETDTAIPTDIVTYRAAVRTASETIETAITNANTLEEFINLYNTPVDAEGNITGKAPIHNWPEPLE